MYCIEKYSNDKQLAWMYLYLAWIIFGTK